MKLDITDLLKEEILLQKEDADFDWHQSILNIGYTRWQNDDTIVSYSDMIGFMVEMYGTFSALMILVGKYNQQVCNGGHRQYYDNGYSDGEGGFNSERDPDMPLHYFMIELFSGYLYKVENQKLINQTEYETLVSGFEIMKDFMNVDIDTESDIQEEEYDEENNETYINTYSNPDLNCISHFGYKQCEKLDSRYYVINDKLLEIYSKVIQQLIED